MIEFVAENLLFLGVFIVVMFFPGVVLMRYIDKKHLFDPVETLVISFVLSLSLALFSAILMDVLNIRIDAVSLSVLYITWIILFVLFVRNSSRNAKEFLKNHNKKSFSFGFLIIFTLLVLLKSLFLSQNPIPISTDLGHHMYWSQSIILSGELPKYQEREILMADSENEKHSVSEPEPISDVIVGEHVIFSVIAILTGTSLISLYPMFTLFFVHIMTLLGVYLLARRLFAGTSHSETLAVFSLFGVGILFGLDSPQMKYIVGGVVGNTLGNLFIVMSILVFLVGIMKKNSIFLSLGIFFLFVLAYTHHLSTLLFALSLVGIVTFLFIFGRKYCIQNIVPLLLRPSIWIVLVMGLFLFFFVWTPSYITNKAVQTVVGSPVEKEEHMGISFEQYALTIGEDRAYFGVFGIIFLSILVMRRFRNPSQNKNDFSLFAPAILMGWAVPLLVLVFFPSLVGIDIPTVRTANYTIIPFVLLTSLFVIEVFSLIQREKMLPPIFLQGFVFMFFLGFAFSGWADNIGFLNSGNSPIKAGELHRLASFLGEKYSHSEETIMYDHININGGSWIKSYFMRDYNYPFYRAHLFRYDRSSDKSERCTLDAISYPETKEARKCYQDLNIKAIAINESLDGKKFRENEEFSRVYSGENFSVYEYFGK